MQGELWEKAINDARARAEQTVQAVGMKIDSVFAISRVPFSQIAPDMFSTPGGEATTERVVVTGQPEYVLGPVMVTENVHIIYLISPAR